MQTQFVRLTAGSGPIDGNAQATAPLAIDNVDDGVRQCRIYVTGLSAPWYDLQPRDIALAAGESRPIQLTVRPPQAALGHYPFSVSARSDAGVETLAFTLVIGTGGAIRIYPGPVTMQDRLAARSVVAARPPVVARPQRMPPRLLALAVPLLLLLLLLGVVVAKQSSGAPATGARLAGAPEGAPAKTRIAADALAATRIAAAGADHSGAPTRVSPTGAAGVAPSASPESLPLLGAVIASETAAAGGAEPARPGRAAPGAARSVRGQATAAPAPVSQPAVTSQPASSTTPDTAIEPAIQPTATSAPHATATSAPPPTAVSSPTTIVAHPIPSPSPTASATRPAEPRPAAAGVVQITRAKAAATPVSPISPRGVTPHPTPTRAVAVAGSIATPVHIVAAVRAVRPARHAARATQPRITSGPAKQRLVAQRRVTTRPAPRQPVRATHARRGVLPRYQSSHRVPARPRTQSRPHAQLQRVRPAQQSRRARAHSAPTRRLPAHTPARSTATRRASPLRVTWPGAATLHFDRRNVLRLSTEPGASIVVTLRAMIRVRGVGGRELTQPYHYTTYAVADRYGQATIPLRSAYVPTQPTLATLTVVARTAHGTIERVARMTLLRQ